MGEAEGFLGTKPEASSLLDGVLYQQQVSANGRLCTGQTCTQVPLGHLPAGEPEATAPSVPQFPSLGTRREASCLWVVAGTERDEVPGTE